MAHQEPGERFAESEDRYRAAMEDTPALVCCFRTTGEAGEVHWQRWTLRALSDRYGVLTGFQAHGEKPDAQRF